MLANTVLNGDFSLGHANWTGFLNTVNAPTTADDIYVNQPLANLKLLASGAAEFIGFYDPSGPGSYSYRLAPPSPHLSQTVNLDAGNYTLNFDMQVVSSGMNINQKFEVRLDGVQIDLESLWVAQASGSYGAATGTRSVSFAVAGSGSHSLSFGFNQPGFNLDTAGSYVQYANHVILDNIAIVAAVSNHAPTGEVFITGLAEQGQTLKAGNTLGDLDGLGVVTYQWQADGVPVAGATGDSFTLTGLEVGKAISVLARYTDGLGTPEMLASASTVPVMLQPDLVLLGSAANDTLIGGGGNDTLDGKAGQDLLQGGEGSDLYLIGQAGDHRAAEIVDTGSLGRDEVRFAASTPGTLTLYAGDLGIEQVTLGSASDSIALNVNAAALANGLTLLGNAGANKITGTAFADTLDGGAGSDRLVGGGGNDSYVVDLLPDGSLQDIVVERGLDAADTLILRGTSANATASVVSLQARAIENLDASGTGMSLLNLTGNAAANALQGNGANNLLQGLAGNDTLFGGEGADTLDGGAGADLFIYSAVSQSNRASTDVLKGLDLGGADAASAVDQLSFAGLTLTGASAISVTSKQISTIAILETTLNSSLMPLASAVLMHVSSGVAAGADLLFVDANGIAGYQAAGDYAIQLVGLVNAAGFDLSDVTG